jgi:hypothetical protein
VESRKWKKRLWIHPLTKKRAAGDVISYLIIELCQDERKFQNFTCMKPETFDCVLLLVTDIIAKSDTNFRTSIPSQRETSGDAEVSFLLHSSKLNII